MVVISTRQPDRDRGINDRSTCDVQIVEIPIRFEDAVGSSDRGLAQLGAYQFRSRIGQQFIVADRCVPRSRDDWELGSSISKEYAGQPLTSRGRQQPHIIRIESGSRFRLNVLCYICEALVRSGSSISLMGA